MIATPEEHLPPIIKPENGGILRLAACLQATGLPRHGLVAHDPDLPQTADASAEQRDEAILPSKTPRKIDLGSIVLTVLPQPPENKADENDNSIGIRLQHGAFSALLTGDSESGERAFWESNVPELVQDCTVLKLAHHGSRNGTDARWLRIVRPKLAVASLGAGNEFGHPHAQTVTLLGRREIPLLQTDRDVTVTILSDGKRWEIVGSRQAPRGPPDPEEPGSDRSPTVLGTRAS